VGRETSPLVKEYGPPPADRALASLAARQHGLVTTAQLLQAGFTNGAVTKRVTTGRLHRIHRGVYALGHARLSREGQWMAAVLAAGEGAVLSHLSAAVHWAIWRRRVTAIHVTAPRSRGPKPAIRIHRSRNLDPRDVTVRDGIPVTTVARTLVDLTDVLTAHQLANVIHEAAFRNLFHAGATRAAMDRANGRRRLNVLTAALGAHNAGSAGTKSNNEDRFLALLRASDLPPPQVTVHVQDVEVDFHWPDLKLCVEVDGPGHTRPRTRSEDRARDHTLTAAGHRVLRITEEDLRRGTIPASLDAAVNRE
jgi:hypothetical protein